MITCTNMYSATTVTDIHTESDKGTDYNYIGTCTVPLQSQYAHSLTKVLVFRFSKFSWLYRYMYMITCTNMYSATTVTVYTQSLQRYWFSGFQGFHGLIII